VRTVTPAPELTNRSPDVEVATGVVELVEIVVWASAVEAAKNSGAEATAANKRFIEIPETKTRISPNADNPSDRLQIRRNNVPMDDPPEELV